MPPHRAVQGRDARRNVENQGVPNAPEVQLQEEVTNTDFQDAIWMLGQVVANQEVVDTSRIHEFLRMNPRSFTNSSITEDTKNFVEELQKVFEVMHVADVEVLLESGLTNGRRVELKSAFMGRFFPRELSEAKMVVDMRSKMSLFVVGLSRLSSKEGKATMLIGDMGIARLMIHMQQVGEDKLRDTKEFQNKKAKTRNESGQQRSNANRLSFKQNQKEPVPSSAIALAPRNKGEFNNQNSQNFRAIAVQSHGSVAQRGNGTPACAKCGRNHLGVCRDGSSGCFKCGQNGHFMEECPKNKQGGGNGGNRAQSSSVAPPDRDVPRGVTSGAGIGANRLYARCCNCYDQNPEESLSFVTPYISMNFDILLEQLLEPFCVSTRVGKSILTKRVYHDCTIFINHRNTMADLVELDMADFNVWTGFMPVIPQSIARKLVSKGCIYHLVRINDSSVEIPPIHSIPVVSEFPEVFPDDLPVVPPKRESYFGIDIIPNTHPIYIPPYRMTSTELKELKERLKDLLEKGFIRPSVSPWGAPWKDVEDILKQKYGPPQGFCDPRDGEIIFIVVKNNIYFVTFLMLKKVIGDIWKFTELQ
ncbi:hypothetical protein H5410_041292 [Solanum commersonii]|uniref:CCHC-type domain-containing protein n=1 Tax=Solanum commersonii TaxID=4109 RepID=A0A9J5XSM3_SOLCO|nr:hypothetical protein H5410_041292 [Solanum commersonii]